MFVRRVRELVLLSLAALMVGCGNPSGLDSVQVSPNSQSLTVGQTTQLTATGIFGNARHPSTQNLTNSVSWSSTSPAIATVNASGLVTAVAPGTTTINANAQAFNGPTSASASITVAGTPGTGGGSATGNLTSLTIIPSSISVGNLQLTGQFLAIGTFSEAPFVRDITNSPTVTWISATPNVFPVTTNTAGNLGAPAGIVTAYGNGTAQITAEAINPGDNTIQTASATFSCPLKLPNPPTDPGSCYPGTQATPLLLTLTVYNLGLNNTSWRITAPSATGTPDVLHCGPGSDGPSDPSGSVCTASYPSSFQIPVTQDPSLNPFHEAIPKNMVVLKATQLSDGAFGGWSYTCTPSDQFGTTVVLDQSGQPVLDQLGQKVPVTSTASGPNYCVTNFIDPLQQPTPPPPKQPTITNATVGAVFNNQ